MRGSLVASIWLARLLGPRRRLAEIPCGFSLLAEEEKAVCIWNGPQRLTQHQYLRRSLCLHRIELNSTADMTPQ
jgi:hypothetical protein